MRILIILALLMTTNCAAIRKFESDRKDRAEATRAYWEKRDLEEANNPKPRYVYEQDNSMAYQNISMQLNQIDQDNKMRNMQYQQQQIEHQQRQLQFRMDQQRSQRVLVHH